MAAAQRKQSWGSGQDATGGSERSYSAWTPTAASRDGLAAQRLQERGRCRPPRPVSSSPLPAFPGSLRGPGGAPPSAPPGPAWPCGGVRVRARARGAGPVPLPNVRAPHAQSAPAVSVCLNRKADILVPHGPPRPTPQALAARLALSPARATAPPRSSPSRSRRDRALVSLTAPSPARPLPSLHRAPTSPCAAGHRSSSPGSAGTKWETEAIPRGPALGRGGSVRRAGPSGSGDAGLDRLQRLREERARPGARAAAAAAAAGTAPRPPFAFAFPLLPPLLPGGVSTLLFFLSPLLPISGPGALHGEGGRGPLG